MSFNRRNISLILIAVAVAMLIGMLYSAAAFAEKTYSFSGRGTAHGVGLDMAGVKALADRGKGYEEILKTYYQGVSLAGGYRNKQLRVGILNGGELQFTAGGGYTVYANNSRSGTHVAHDVITHVTYENGQYVTRVDGIGSWTMPGFTRIEPDPGAYIKILNNGRRYRGHMEARRSSTGLLWAIDVVNIEGYVKGLAEEPNTWPTEAQRTLAVSGRTYALYKKFYSTRWDTENFDIGATTGEQYYLGRDAERPNLVQAVLDTRGKAIVYGGKVIVAAYHGNSGGYTESIENVWGGDPVAYLRAVSSPWTPVYHWGPKTFTKSQLQNIFNSRSESYIGTLQSIDLSDKTVSGRVRKVRLAGSAGTKVVWGYSQFAVWLGLPSSLIDNKPSKPNDHWDEYISISNPNNERARARLIFLFPNKRRKIIRRWVKSHSSRTVKVDRTVKDGPVAVKIRSSKRVVAERSVYFAYANAGGGHNSVGARFRASRRWYFAEGRTGSDFDTYLLITNPRTKPVKVKMTFMPGRNKRIKKTILVPGNSRRSVKVGSISGLARRGATPAVIRSRKPVVVERTTYFAHRGRVGGHAGIGAKKTSRRWYFAEGYTGSGFIARLLIFNPRNRTTRATVILSKNDGSRVSRSFNVKAHARRRINLNTMLSGVEFGITVIADSGVTAERTTYFNSGGKTGGHSTVGATAGSTKWYFAKGPGGSSFDEFLTLLNVTAKDANITIEYLSQGGGAAAVENHVVKANSRKTITIGNIGGSDFGQAAGIVVSSNRQIVAERVTYFSYAGNRGRSNWTGGYATMGTPRLSRRWFFAEGFTERK